MVDEEEHSERIDPRLVEDRVGLISVLGKLVIHSLPNPDFREDRIHYGPDSHQNLLVFRPNEGWLERHTAVYFLHGGGWHSGSPTLYRFAGPYFAGLGFPTLVGGYRLAPEHIYPAQLDDVVNGLVAGLDLLADRGAEVKRVIVGGISAGAQLAALLVYDRLRQSNSPLPGEILAGFFSICGPLDFSYCTNPAISKMIEDFTGADAANRELANPIRYLRGDEQVPAFFIHGKRDPLVDVQNTISFSTRLKQAGKCQVEVRLIKGGHHADLAALFVEDLPAGRAFERWLNRCDR